jgi:hypothetical protein
VYRLVDGSNMYYAPDIKTLMSGDFLPDHCFRFATGTDSALLGVAFEPARNRRNVPGSQTPGGAMHFDVLANGAWAISNWELRIPVLRVSSRW